MKYEIPQDVINNIFYFLDKVEYKGFKELEAINKIVNILNNPIKDEE